MSVKVHEAFSLDSAQDRYLFFDHFLGDQIKDEWDVSVVGTGSANVIDAQTGGIVRLAAPTNATADEAELDWGDYRSLLVTKKVTIEARAKMSDTTNILVTIGLRFGGNDFFQFIYNTAGIANWGIRVRAAGVGGISDTGVAPDTSEHIFRIEAFPTGEVHFYIDGVETANSPITTNIPADYLQPRLFIRTLTTALKQLDIDYVVVRQER